MQASAYLTGPADYERFGVALAQAPQVMRASLLIDHYLRRPEGCIWMPDANGIPAFMAAKTPTMVLAGAEDILIPMGLSRQLHAAIPGAEWATSKGGHAFLWEFPKPFNKKVLGFIGKHR